MKIFQFSLGIIAAAFLASNSALAQEAEIPARSNYSIMVPNATMVHPERPIGNECTQLEIAAKIEKEMCGKMELNDVVKTMFPPSA